MKAGDSPFKVPRDSLTISDIVRADSVLATINEDQQITLADFEILSILGQGSSGTVYKANQRYGSTKQQSRVVALKEVKMRETISKKQYKDVINEVEMMKRIKHPHIIQLYDSFIDRQYDTAGLKKKQEDISKI